jgi:hypothetical protein
MPNPSYGTPNGTETLRMIDSMLAAAARSLRGSGSIALK